MEDYLGRVNRRKFLSPGYFKGCVMVKGDSDQVELNFSLAEYLFFFYDSLLMLLFLYVRLSSVGASS